MKDASLSRCDCMSYHYGLRVLHGFIREGNMSWWGPVVGKTPLFYKAKRAR